MPVDFERQAAGGQETLDPIGVLGGLLLESDQLAVQLAGIFLLDGWNLDHAPDLRLSADIANQHAQQLRRIEAIALGPPLAAVDLDARRVDHHVLDSLGQETAMQPEAVPSRLIAAHYRAIRWQSQPSLGRGDLSAQARHIAGGHVAPPRRCTRARGKRQLPRVPTQFERQVQHRLNGSSNTTITMRTEVRGHR